jgi:hypothetical protein
MKQKRKKRVKTQEVTLGSSTKGVLTTEEETIVVLVILPLAVRLEVEGVEETVEFVEVESVRGELREGSFDKASED